MITLENKMLKVCLNPDFGCKIHSFLHKETGFELAAQSEREVQVKGSEKKAVFGDYAYGFDDAFPNIDAESLSLHNKTFNYPDHGMVWDRKFRVINAASDSALCAFKDDDLKLTYTKSFSLKGETLTSEISIEYEESSPFPCIYTFHGLIKYEDDMEIMLPKGSDKLINVLKHPGFGDVGNILGTEDVSKIPKYGSGDMLKYYVCGRVKEGKCGVKYTKSGMAYELSYDSNCLPYLGVWITAGGLDGANNMALEPSDGFYDSVSKAIDNKAVKVLKPNEKRLIRLDIRLRRIPEDKDV